LLKDRESVRTQSNSSNFQQVCCAYWTPQPKISQEVVFTGDTVVGDRCHKHKFHGGGVVFHRWEVILWGRKHIGHRWWRPLDSRCGRYYGRCRCVG